MSPAPAPMRSVCIIGAGPAGLAAAKTFLQNGHFSVTVFERQPRIGGIWAVTQDDGSARLHPETPLNFSRWSFALSGLDWNEVDLGRAGTENQSVRGVGFIPVFPRAWQVNRYLEAYRRKFIPAGVIQLSTRVTAARRSDPLVDGLTAAAKIWDVTTERDGLTATETFDYLVFASGCYSGMSIPPVLAPAKVPVIHNSRFRKMADLFPEKGNVKGKDILVIGCGISAGEAAAAIALQMSDARWGHGEDTYSESKIIHVTSRKLRACPRFLLNADGQSFLPADLMFWDLDIRHEGSEQAETAPVTSESSGTVNSHLGGCIGSDPAGTDDALAFDVAGKRGLTCNTMADMYMEFVRSGTVEPMVGQLVKVTGDAIASADIVGENGQTSRIDNIGAIVFATDFGRHEVLDILDEGSGEHLQYDRTTLRSSVIRDQWQTMADNVPELGFVGFIEPAVPPCLEMQARLLAGQWTDETLSARLREASGRNGPGTSGTLLEGQDEFGNRHDTAPHWFHDFPERMEKMAQVLQLEQNIASFGAHLERVPMIAARYKSPGATADELETNDRMARDYALFRHNCIHDGAYVARNVFFALQGDWNIVRTITSTNVQLSGSLQGTASFHPRLASQSTASPDDDEQVEFEQLYTEQGEFTPSASGLTMRASRRYVYRYTESNDTLSVWFVRPDDKQGLKTDYLFHKIKFAPPVPEGVKAKPAFSATADHLCVADMYVTSYSFPMQGPRLHEFEIEHAVKGPNKDYVATTRYSRA